MDPLRSGEHTCLLRWLRQSTEMRWSRHTSVMCGHRHLCVVRWRRHACVVRWVRTPHRQLDMREIGKSEPRSVDALRRNPTKTATQYTASLSVHELLSCGLPMTLLKLCTGTVPTTSLGACSLSA